jgi:Pvc16 N-terminal domain
MIRESLQFLADELNKYLILKGTTTTDPPRVVLGNVARVFDQDSGGSGAIPINNRAIITLVNVEEDRIAKQQENYEKTDILTRYKSPPLFLNLYVLFSVNRNSYPDSLGWLNHIIQYFQHQHVFTPISHPSLDSRIEKLIADLFTLNFEQINHLWSTLGGKYLPSVLYKIRQVTIDEDLTVSESGFIKEIELTEKLKLPVSE